MKAADLRNRFKVYLDQIPILVKANAYWALLHFMVIFPDICGSLENVRSESSKANYINWANRYLADPSLTGEEWYDIRCKILHQGITTGRKRYTNYLFISPGNSGKIPHKNVRPDGSIVLDVHAMKDELIVGLEKWFQDNENSGAQDLYQNVSANVSSIAGIVTIRGSDPTSGSIQVTSILVSGTSSPNQTSPKLL